MEESIEQLVARPPEAQGQGGPMTKAITGGTPIAAAWICEPQTAQTVESMTPQQQNNGETMVGFARRKRKLPNCTQVADKSVTEVDAVVEELNKSHFVAPVGGNFSIVTVQYNPQFGRFEVKPEHVTGFRLRYSNWKLATGETAATAWMESPNRREFKGVVFAPGQKVSGYFNLFRGFTVKPVRGNCCLFWQHVFFNICGGDRDHYRYLRRWMAHLIQRPSELPGVAIVIRGKQGTGKGVFVEALSSLLGQHAMTLNNVSQLVSRFNGHLMDLLLVNANEAIWGGDKAGEGTLKALITDATALAEFKGFDMIQVANFKRFIITSNESWPVPMGMDDRRYLVLEASDARKEDKSYFGAIINQLNGGGREALLHDLMTEDLSGFEVRTKPHSKHGFDIKLRSAEPIVKWWFERLHSGVLIETADELTDDSDWSRTPVIKVVYQAFVDFCKVHQARPVADSVFGKELRKMIPGHFVPETRPNDGTAGRRRRYCLPSLEECRRAFEVYAKAGSEIWS